MRTAHATSVCTDKGMSLQNRFMALWPRMQAVIRFRLHGKFNRSWREEMMAEATAYAWKSVVALDRRGVDWTAWPCGLANRVVTSIFNMRRVAIADGPREPLSELVQARHGLQRHSMDGSFRQHATNVQREGKLQRDCDREEEAYADSSAWPVPDLACYHVDWPEWLDQLEPRERTIVAAYEAGEQGRLIAARLGFSPAWLSRIRLALHDEWQARIQ